MTDPNATRLPRLGDRADLEIDVSRMAVSAYQGFLADRRPPFQRLLSDEQAREELLELLRDSYVVSSIGDSMQTRVRSARLGVEVQAELTRRSATRVRVVSVHPRVYDRSKRSTRDKRPAWEGSTARHKISGGGALAVFDGVVRWRPQGGGAWQEPRLRELARTHAADSTVWLWLRQHGVTRPAPSGPSGPTQPEDERAGEQVKLRLASDVAARLRELAARRGLTISALVTDLVRAAR